MDNAPGLFDGVGLRRIHYIAYVRPALEFRQQMEDLLLSTDVRARIALHPAIEDVDIEIKVEDGVGTISGIADSMREEDRIMEVMRETPGVRDIHDRLRVRTSGLCDGG